jgi:hypothetical protein
MIARPYNLGNPDHTEGDFVEVVVVDIIAVTSAALNPNDL